MQKNIRDLFIKNILIFMLNLKIGTKIDSYLRIMRSVERRDRQNSQNNEDTLKIIESLNNLKSQINSDKNL